MNDTSSSANKQLGLLDLSVDLSAPEVYSGTEFTLYLHVKNPFSQPAWIKSVELSLPAQLSALESNKKIQETGSSEFADELTRKAIRERQAEIKRLRDSIQTGSMNDDDRKNAQARLQELEGSMRTDLANLTGALIVELAGGSNVTLESYSKASG